MDAGAVRIGAEAIHVGSLEILVVRRTGRPCADESRGRRCRLPAAACARPLAERQLRTEFLRAGAVLGSMKIIGDGKMGQPMGRRTALRAAASAPLAGLFAGSMTAQQNSAPPDPPREITSDRADIGSLFPDIERLVNRNQYPYSFLNNRFRSLEEYRAAGRGAVLD